MPKLHAVLRKMGGQEPIKEKAAAPRKMTISKALLPTWRWRSMSPRRSTLFLTAIR
jgi:hypothetical protein